MPVRSKVPMRKVSDLPVALLPLLSSSKVKLTAIVQQETELC